MNTVNPRNLLALFLFFFVSISCAATAIPETRYLDHGVVLMGFAYSHEGMKLATADSKSNINVWDTATGKLLFELHGHSKYVTDLSFSPDGSRLVSVSWDKRVIVWNMANGTIEKMMSGHAAAISSVVFMPDGEKIISGSEDKTIRIWSLATGETLQILKGHNGAVSSLAISQDGRLLASGGGQDGNTIRHDYSIRIWDLATGKQLSILDGHEQPALPKRLAFSTDGKKLAAGDTNGVIRLWDMTTMKFIRKLIGHADNDNEYWRNINSLAFIPRSEWLVSAGSTPNPLRFWDISSGYFSVLPQINNNSTSYKDKIGENPIPNIRFSSDGKYLVVQTDPYSSLILPVEVTSLVTPDEYLSISDPSVKRWVQNNLVTTNDLPTGNWYETKRGKVFLSDEFMDGYRVSNPQWFGDSKNGLANGSGSFRFETTMFVNVVVNIKCYMLNGSIVGKATFSDAQNRNMIQTKTVFVGNNKVMSENEYDDFITARYAMGMALDKAIDPRFAVRYAFKSGIIGTRYVPITSNKIYNTETLYNIGNTPVTKTTSYTQTEGGNAEKVNGQTAVIGFANNTKDYYILKTLVGGTFENSTYHKGNTFLWFGSEVTDLVKNRGYVTIAKDYLVKPGEEIKDQIVVGEAVPADFKVGFTNTVQVEKSWVDGLEKTLNAPINTCPSAKAYLQLMTPYLTEINASSWVSILNNRKQEAKSVIDRTNKDPLLKLIKASVSVDARYDMDFENDATATINNNSDQRIQVSFTDPMQQQNSIDVLPKSSASVRLKIKGVEKNNLNLKIDDVTLVDDAGSKLEFTDCPVTAKR